VSSVGLALRGTSRLRVLLVEDDPSFVQFLRDSLPTWGAEELHLTAVTRLSAAIVALKEDPFDAVLLDLNLPDSHGLPTLQELTRADDHVPVVVLTGIDDTSSAQEAMRLGAQDWLTKDHSDPDLVVRALHYAVERKRLTDRLTQSQKLEAIGQLARNVAHEFNNLLTIILGHAALVGATGDPQVRNHAAGEIEQAAKRGALLTRQLLGIARPKVQAAAVGDVRQAIMSVNGLCEAVLPRTVTMEVVAGETAVVPMPQEQLEQVLLNLVLNARDAMPYGGTITMATTRSDASRDGSGPANNHATAASRIQVRVQDTGTGIHPETLPRLFEPFFTTKGESGTGLGLMIAQELIEHAGGTIRIESEYGNGATVLIDLPVEGA
jgi:two-component system, cell cycle sensor histidine kinase and response regulator CckA